MEKEHQLMFTLAASAAMNKMAQMPAYPRPIGPVESPKKDTRFKPKKEKKEKTEFTDVIHAIKDRGGYSWTELAAETAASMQDLVKIPGWNDAIDFHFHDRNLKRWADEGQTPTPIFRILLRFGLRRLLAKQTGKI